MKILMVEADAEKARRYEENLKYPSNETSIEVTRVIDKESALKILNSCSDIERVVVAGVIHDLPDGKKYLRAVR